MLGSCHLISAKRWPSSSTLSIACTWWSAYIRSAVAASMALLVADGGNVATSIVNRHILIFVVEDVVMEDRIIASLFFKEVAICMQMLFIRVHSNEVSSPLILQHRLLDHGIVRSL